MENVEKKLYCYCLFDKKTETYSMLCTGYDDKDSIDYFVNGFNDINKSLDNYYKGEKLDKEKANLIEKIHDSCIYRVGFFNSFSGEFVNEKLLLIDLFDFKFKEVKITNEKSS